MFLEGTMDSIIIIIIIIIHIMTTGLKGVTSLTL